MGKPVRLGVIGAGRWGQVYLRTLESFADRCQVSHVVSSKSGMPGVIPPTAKILPHAQWRELLKACDAVIIATPPDTHAEMVEACVEAKKPCLVEKPLCLDAATAERLRDRVKASGVPVLVDHTHLFNPAYEELRGRVRKGGEPVRAIISGGMSFGPFRSHTSSLWDYGPHDVGLCLDLMGAPPASVTALGGPRNAAGEPETVAIRLEFPGPATAWINIGRLSARKLRRFSVFTDTTVYVFDDQSGTPLTTGRIDFPGRYAGGGPEEPALTPVSSVTPGLTMPRVIRYFLDGLGGGDRSRFGLDLALEVTRVLATCEETMS